MAQEKKDANNKKKKRNLWRSSEVQAFVLIILELCPCGFAQWEKVLDALGDEGEDKGWPQRSVEQARTKWSNLKKWARNQRKPTGDPERCELSKLVLQADAACRSKYQMTGLCDTDTFSGSDLSPGSSGRSTRTSPRTSVSPLFPSPSPAGKAGTQKASADGGTKTASKRKLEDAFASPASESDSARIR